jgi:hypothetical protein
MTRRERHAQANERADAVVQEITNREPRVQRARARYELANRLLRVIVAIMLAASLGLLIYLAGSANAGAEAIQDCTTPGGECYERSQAQTAVVVGQIVKAQQDAAIQGSAPSRENLTLTKANAQNISVILGILDREYPEAAAAVRRELGVK